MDDEIEWIDLSSEHMKNMEAMRIKQDELLNKLMNALMIPKKFMGIDDKSPMVGVAELEIHKLVNK